jgi:hypothetical protein
MGRLMMLPDKEKEGRFYVQAEVGDMFAEAKWSAEYFARANPSTKVFERIVNVPSIGFAYSIQVFPEKSTGWERIVHRCLGYFAAFVNVAIILMLFASATFLFLAFIVNYIK